MNEKEYPPVLTLDQAAEYLQLSPEILIKELEQGLLPGRKFSGEWRISRTHLEKYLAGVDITRPSSETFATITQVTSDINQQNIELLPQESSQSIKHDKDKLSPNQTNKIRGFVYATNTKEKYGHIRLADGRVVWLDYINLLPHSPLPTVGDLVEFELEKTKKTGWTARSVEVIAEKLIQQKTLTLTNKLPDKADNNIFLPPTNKVASIKDTDKVKELYAKAAIAHTEGKYDEAKKYFHEAIHRGAGPEIFVAYFKMCRQLGWVQEARQVIKQAIASYPKNSQLYDLYGQMERRKNNFESAEKIFREGLKQVGENQQLLNGLAQVLMSKGDAASIEEAGKVYKRLEKREKFNKNDPFYLRFKAFERSHLVGLTYDFFTSANMRVNIAGRRDLPKYITDLIIEVDDPVLKESFNIHGAYLARCFQKQPTPREVYELKNYLTSLTSQSSIGLIGGGKEIIPNNTIALIITSDTNSIRDLVMSILGDNREAIIPISQKELEQKDNALQVILDLFRQYLGQRDLYDSVLPVSGRKFFGRENIIYQLVDLIYQGNFIGIFGLRKIGKTSLIYQLRDEKLREEAVCYVDLQSGIAQEVNSFAPIYWELERDLYKRLVFRYPELHQVLRLGQVERFSDIPNKGKECGLIFDEDIRLFLDGVVEKKYPQVNKLIIILDELEKVLPVGNQPGVDGYIEFFGKLRGLAQTERYRGYISSIVAAANAAINDQGYWEGRENPVFSFYKPVYLSTFEYEECREMIESLGKGMSVYWEEDAIKAVFEETAGHPFLTRVFCSRITKANPTRPLNITKQIVHEQLSCFIRDESNKMEQIIELLRTNFPEEERILEKIALDELNDISYLDEESIYHLLSYGLISEENGKFRIRLNILKRWIRRRAGIKDE